MQAPATAPLTLAIRDDRELLLAVSAENRLFCIELQTNGVMRWVAPLGKVVSQPVVAVDNDVFVLAEDGELSKWDLLTGRPIEGPTGTRCRASRQEEDSKTVPAYGAAVEVQLSGDPAFHPLHILNRSTGHRLSSVVLNLASAQSNLGFTSGTDGRPAVRMIGGQDATGVRTAELSADQRQLTLTFRDFDPGEALSFYVDLSHPERKAFDIRDSDLSGARVDALVVTGSGSTGVTSRIFGEFRTGLTGWKVNRVQSLAAVTGRAVYFIDDAGRLAAVNRESGTPLNEAATPGYSLHISNALTDRVYLGSSSGQVACFAEARVELGVLALPVGGALTFAIAPESLLSADFAKFHQHPGGQPIMPEVSPAGPESDNSASE
jgi:hypothetical protein